MARDRIRDRTPPEAEISIIGPRTKIVGHCETTTTVRVEGIVEGSITAMESVVIGKEGVVTGDVAAQEAVVAGRFSGTLVVESRLELQATCQLEGEIHTGRMQVAEGATLNGSVHIGGQGSPQAGRSGGRQPRIVSAGLLKDGPQQESASLVIVSDQHVRHDLDRTCAASWLSSTAESRRSPPISPSASSS